jgi:hypothetical protein
MEEAIEGCRLKLSPLLGVMRLAGMQDQQND